MHKLQFIASLLTGILKFQQPPSTLVNCLRQAFEKIHLKVDKVKANEPFEEELAT